MSVEITSKLMLVPDVDVYNHFESAVTMLDFWEVLETMGLDYASPYYDSDPREWVVGIEISQPSFLDLAEVNSAWHMVELDKAITKLEKLFPDCWKTAKLVSCPHVI